MNNLNNEIYKKYNSQLTKKTRIKINELNSNLYGMGCESEGFEFIIVNTKNKDSRLILCASEVQPLKDQEAA